MYVCEEDAKLITIQPMKSVVTEREGEEEWMASVRDRHLNPLSSSLINTLFTAVELSKYTVLQTH